MKQQDRVRTDRAIASSWDKCGRELYHIHGCHPRGTASRRFPTNRRNQRLKYVYVTILLLRCDAYLPLSRLVTHVSRKKSYTHFAHVSVQPSPKSVRTQTKTIPTWSTHIITHRSMFLPGSNSFWLSRTAQPEIDLYPHIVNLTDHFANTTSCAPQTRYGVRKHVVSIDKTTPSAIRRDFVELQCETCHFCTCVISVTSQLFHQNCDLPRINHTNVGIVCMWPSVHATFPVRNKVVSEKLWYVCFFRVWKIKLFSLFLNNHWELSKYEHTIMHTAQYTSPNRITCWCAHSSSEKSTTPTLIFKFKL